mmetsp:Transcript_24117/g.53463  ORF Transcript_24117/g.53463 Transcript_24117/m.53463 type:complete len:213 (-) Transcript_24117:181-819(-)
MISHPTMMMAHSRRLQTRMRCEQSLPLLHLEKALLGSMQEKARRAQAQASPRKIPRKSLVMLSNTIVTMTTCVMTSPPRLKLKMMSTFESSSRPMALFKTRAWTVKVRVVSRMTLKSSIVLTASKTLEKFQLAGITRVDSLPESPRGMNSRISGLLRVSRRGMARETTEFTRLLPRLRPSRGGFSLALFLRSKEPEGPKAEGLEGRSSRPRR